MAALAPRICILTASHLSTSPRMLKAADALAGAGYSVRVVSARYLPWAVETDDEVRTVRHGAWAWHVVDYDRRTGRRISLGTALRFRAVKVVARAVGPTRCPMSLAARAWSRAHPELLHAALRKTADLFYGGGAALAAVAEAGRRAGAPYAIDLEDFHTAEREESSSGKLAHGLAERIERHVLTEAAFLTASSTAIASAYVDKYGVCPLVVNNTFPLPRTEPDLAPRPAGRLRLYWFSQTIGPGRGLEDAVRAMGLAGVPGELHLRGAAIPAYLQALRGLADGAARHLQIIHRDPAPPDAMIELCHGHDVGLALEPGFSLNNRLALSNKALTYMLGGLALVLTDTVGQRPLASELGAGALLYGPGDVGALAAGLRRWADDPDLLARARATAWEAARRRWHWEHPEERGALLAAVAGVLGRSA